MATDTTYNPKMDPYRVSESVLREHFAPGKMVHPGFRIVALGRYVAGGEGCYAAVYAVTEDNTSDRSHAPAQAAYCTHLLVLPSEADGLRQAYAQHGHYDLTLAEARDDLATR